MLACGEEGMGAATLLAAQACHSAGPAGGWRRDACARAISWRSPTSATDWNPAASPRGRASHRAPTPGAATSPGRLIFFVGPLEPDAASGLTMPASDVLQPPL